MQIFHVKNAVAIILLTFSALVMADTSSDSETALNGFFGISGGQANYKYSQALVNADVNNVVSYMSSKYPGVNISGAATVDSSDIGYKMFIGFWGEGKSSNKGFELGYVTFGNPKETVTTTGVATTTTADFVGNAFYAAALLRRQLGDSQFIAKLGAYTSTVSYNINSSLGYTYNSSSAYTTNPVVGLGYEYSIDHDLSLRVEYEWFSKINFNKATSQQADIGYASLGVISKF